MCSKNILIIGKLSDQHWHCQQLLLRLQLWCVCLSFLYTLTDWVALQLWWAVVLSAHTNGLISIAAMVSWSVLSVRPNRLIGIATKVCCFVFCSAHSKWLISTTCGRCCFPLFVETPGSHWLYCAACPQCYQGRDGLVKPLISYWFRSYKNYISTDFFLLKSWGRSSAEVNV